MAELSLEEYLDHIRLEVPQCPREIMKAEFLRITRDFCQHTRAYQFEVTDESILQLVSDYDIEVPNTQVQPVAVEYLTVNGAQSVFKDLKWIQDNIPNWRARSANDFTYFTQVQPLQITFPCVPTQNGTVGGLKYWVSLKPKLSADTLDDVFAGEWQDTLEAGTKAHLMLMDGKPWYKPKRAVGLLAEYRHERSRARVRVSRAYGNPEQRVSAPKFA